VNSVAFTPDGQILVSGSDDKTIKLWNPETGKTIVTLSGHSKGVSSVVFSPDGHSLASGSFDKTIKIWQLA
jgi:WD40 repeat protein